MGEKGEKKRKNPGGFFLSFSFLDTIFYFIFPSGSSLRAVCKYGIQLAVEGSS